MFVDHDGFSVLVAWAANSSVFARAVVAKSEQRAVSQGGPQCLRLPLYHSLLAAA